jgi:putative glycosyltransferase (TIGR04372 family)
MSGPSRLVEFLSRQVRHIQVGGLPILGRKSRLLLRKVASVIASPLLVPVSFAVRAASPVALFRFGELPSGRIGHYSVDVERYLCERDAGLHPRRSVDIFYDQIEVSNRQLKRMWRRVLRVWPGAALVDTVGGWFPGWERHTVAPRGTVGNAFRDTGMSLAGSGPHLRFTPREERRGREGLVRLGIPEAAEFVCFGARDNAYLAKTQPTREWAYHDYRNSDIRNYVAAAEALARRGLYAVRTGAAVESALDGTGPMIVDYASMRGSDDFMDIYLGARCRFCIYDTAGIYGISVAFRRPIVFVNFAPLEYVHSWSPDYITIPMKLRSKDTRRILTFRETLESGAGRFLESADYAGAGLEVVQNTSAEIEAVSLEMYERLNGTWDETPQDRELQKEFWSLLADSDLHGVIASRIGAEFLRENRDLLA